MGNELRALEHNPVLRKKYKLDKKFSFISTGGGAMVDFLAGEKLPGIEALK